MPRSRQKLSKTWCVSFRFMPKRFIGQIAKRPCGALMAADAGVAVLALIEFLLFDAKPPCRCRSVDLRSRDQTDNTAAVAADLRDLQTHSPLYAAFAAGGSMAALVTFFLSSRRTHDILQVIGVLCADGQHTALRDAEGDRTAERLQAGCQLLCAVPVARP